MGFVCFAKRIERGKFTAARTSGTVALTPAQLFMLLEGIDWRRPIRSGDRRWRCKGEILQFF